MDVRNFAKFNRNRLTGLDFVGGGSNFDHSIGMRCRR